MKLPPRTCSECDNVLEGKYATAKTCSPTCRTKRSRRLRRERREAEVARRNYQGGADEVTAIVRRQEYDAVMRVTQQEIQPIVREALTEDILRAVQGMIGLTPRAVELLAEDLESEDSTIRQRAYTLLIKYTAGHPALLRPSDAEPGGQLVVNFNLPRPDDLPAPAGDDEPIEAVELQTCDSCGEELPASEFESGSARCHACHETWKSKILEQFA